MNVIKTSQLENPSQQMKNRQEKKNTKYKLNNKLFLILLKSFPFSQNKKKEKILFCWFSETEKNLSFVVFYSVERKKGDIRRAAIIQI